MCQNEVTENKSRGLLRLILIFATYPHPHLRNWFRLCISSLVLPKPWSCPTVGHAVPLNYNLWQMHQTPPKVEEGVTSSHAHRRRGVSPDRNRK